MENKDTTSRAAIMRQHIEACKAGGLVITAYCKQNDLAPSNYYYWQKKLMPPAVKSSFVALQPASITDVVSIHFPNGVRICFEDSVSASVLKDLVCCI